MSARPNAQTRMAKSVPTQSAATNAGKTLVMDGAYLGVGESLGRAIAGPGLGTALGGLAAAATESGETRDTMALVAGERAVSELMSGASGGGQSGGRQRM